jgi:hypothetical protein
VAKYYVLNAEEEACLLKPQRGQGGFQTFMRNRQKAYRKGTQELPVLTDEEIGQAQRYAFDYKQGGWEEDLKAIFSRHLGPNLGR